MPKPIAIQLIDLVRRHGILRPRDLEPHGIPREHLTRLYAQGILERLGRGLYGLAGTEVDQHQSLREACKRIPHGIVCLLSALRFHNLTTQSPFEVWLAIGSKARLPKLAYPPLRIVRFSGDALTEGIVTHRIRGVSVPVTNPSRTVVDCFRYRNKVGLDVALEALRDCRRKRMATIDELHQVAKYRHMINVMRPYLEALA